MNFPLEYNQLSQYFDVLGVASSHEINRVIEKLLEKHKVKTVFDMTCGTGAQVLWLAKRGYQVTGSDLNPNLLKIAKSKARKEKISLKFLQGDMRTLQVGQFDAVITIFNAIGHLTKKGFEKAIRNIHKNLKEGGLYVFDIFNLSSMNDKTLTNLTVDNIETVESIKIRNVQFCTLDNTGRLTSYDYFSLQKKSAKPQILKGKFSLQIYTAKQLRDMLTKNGFRIVRQYAIDGSKFSEKTSERILTVAEKIGE